MKVLYTDQALNSLQECIGFFPPDVSAEKINEITKKILSKAETLSQNPFLGQREEYLEHLGKDHRRLIEGNYKIIYRVESKLDIVYVTDIFDCRQDPSKMKG